MKQRRFLLLLLTILFVNHLSFGQSAGILEGRGSYFEMVRDFENAQMAIGKASANPGLLYEEINGSPYSQEEFQKGELITHDSIRYVNVMLRYNIFTDEVEYQLGGKVFSLANPLDFRYIIIDEDVFVYYPFQTGTGVIKKGYFQLIHLGKALLLKKMKVSYQPPEAPQAYGEAKPARFLKGSDAYFIRFLDRMPEEIAFSRNKLLRVFPDYQHELDVFIKNKRLRFRNEEDLIRLLDYYNEL
jgi:hypothetical protein